jgi:WD40 repeat protein
VLPGGKVVTRDSEGLVQVWDPSSPGVDPADLGWHDGPVGVVAVLPRGKVVTGGDDGRVLIWDPASPGAGPAEQGRHDLAVTAVAVLPDGKVVTGGDDRRVLIWDPARVGTQMIQLSCSLITLVTVPPGPARSDLLIAHQGSGLSLWSFTG